MYAVVWTEMEDAKLEIRPQNLHTPTDRYKDWPRYLSHNAAGESFC